MKECISKVETIKFDKITDRIINDNGTKDRVPPFLNENKPEIVFWKSI